MPGALPTLNQVSLTPVTTGQDQFQRQAAGIPAVAALLQKTADLDNAGYQSGVFGVDPNLKSNIGSVDALARQYSLGGVSDDTRGAINRSTAFNALQGGYAGPLNDATGSGNTGANMQTASNAVQVGQTALNEQLQAPALTQQAAQASLALNPTHVDVGSTLISPAALLARQDAADYYNNQLTNQAMLVNAGIVTKGNQQAQQGAAGGIGGLLGGGGGGLSSLFSGGGGGAGAAADVAGGFV